MNIVEALRQSDIIRREGKASHVGSHGTGWVHVEMLLGQAWASAGFNRIDAYNQLALTKDDLIADDWEARKENELP